MYANSIINSNKVKILNATDFNLNCVQDGDFQIYHTFKHGWARRRVYENLYGRKYIDFYMEEVLELFNQGCRNQE